MVATNWIQNMDHDHHGKAAWIVCLLSYQIWKNLSNFKSIQGKRYSCKLYRKTLKNQSQNSEVWGWWCCLWRQIFLTLENSPQKTLVCGTSLWQGKPCSWSSNCSGEWSHCSIAQSGAGETVFIPKNERFWGVFQVSRALDYPCWFVWKNQDGTMMARTGSELEYHLRQVCDAESFPTIFGSWFCFLQTTSLSKWASCANCLVLFWLL